MDLKCKLIEKSFKDADGNSHAYYVLSFNLTEDETLELPIKGDKAKLLKLSNSINSSKEFWEK